jgi:hypothetical protein
MNRKTTLFNTDVTTLPNHPIISLDVHNLDGASCTVTYYLRDTTTPPPEAPLMMKPNVPAVPRRYGPFRH